MRTCTDWPPQPLGILPARVASDPTVGQCLEPVARTRLPDYGEEGDAGTIRESSSKVDQGESCDIRRVAAGQLASPERGGISTVRSEVSAGNAYFREPEETEKSRSTVLVSR